MHTVNVAAFAAVGFLVVGAMLSVSDVALFDTPYALIIGPISWIVGCALMVAWAIGRIGLAVTRGSDISDEPPSSRKEETTAHQRRATSEAAAADSPTRAAAGHFVADFLAPLTIWLIVLWFLAALVLLLGSEAA